MDVLKVVKDYIDETGSTWYKPQPKYKRFFDGGVQRKVLVEENGYYSLPEIAKQEKKIAEMAVIHTHYSEDIRKTYPNQFLDLYNFEKEGYPEPLPTATAAASVMA